MAKDDDKNAQKQLIFGKYETMEEAEKGFAELNKKLSEQGAQMKEFKKQLQAGQEYMQQATPILDWYKQNYSHLTQMFSGQGQNQYAQAQQAQYRPQAQPNQYQYGQTGQYGQPAGQPNAAQQALMNLLTPEEQKMLVENVTRQVQEQAVNPWTQQFAKTVESAFMDRSKQVEAALINHQKAFSDVLWKTLERIMPADKIEEAKAWHTEALKFADPRNIDPMEVANQALESKRKLAEYESKIKEYEQKAQEREKADAALFQGTRPFSLQQNKQQDAKPATREDRMGAVMGAVKEAHGSDGLREVFGR